MSGLLPPRGGPRTAAGPSGSPAPSEIVLAATAILAVVGVTIAVRDGWILFAKPLALDEYHTLFLGQQPSAWQILRHLARGSDYNPPVLHLAVRSLAALTGGLSPVKLRAFACATVVLAMVLVYAVLRRRAGPVAALTGALALWAHPLVTRAAFDARFYGPWLLLTVAFVAVVTASAPWARSVGGKLATGIVAALLCTIHYFGIFAWALVLAGVSGAAGRGELRGLAARLWPVAAGPVALVLCAPLLVGQRAALAVPTWVPPLSRPLVWDVTSRIFGWLPLALAVLVWAASQGLAPRAGAADRRGGVQAAVRPFSPFVVLALLPVVLVAFSAAVQPVYIDRYAIPAVLVYAAVLASGGASMGAGARAAVLALLLVSAHRSIGDLVRSAHAFAADVASDRRAVRPLAETGELVIATNREIHYTLAVGDPVLARAVRLPEFSDAVVRRVYPVGSDSAHKGDLILLERDVARVHRSLYGVPQLISIGALRARDRFYLVGDERSVEGFARYGLPGVTPRQVAPRLYEVTPGPEGRASGGDPR